MTAKVCSRGRASTLHKRGLWFNNGESQFFFFFFFSSLFFYIFLGLCDIEKVVKYFSALLLGILIIVNIAINRV